MVRKIMSSETRLVRIHHSLYEAIIRERKKFYKQTGVELPLWLASKFYYEKHKKS